MSALARVEAALAAAGSKRFGRSWRCPAHDDRAPSLSVSAGADGRVLIHCHAGCEVADILSVIDLSERDLFDDEPRRDRPMVAAQYVYTDEVGSPLFRVVRFDPKGFRQQRFDPRHPDADPDGFVWGLGDARRVLFNLPAVVAAASSGRGLVVVAEGEKDCLALEASGELGRLEAVATTMPGGAGKWRREYSECLRGCSVMIVADRDDPGRRHAWNVAAALYGVATAVSVAEPRAGKDLADHLAAGFGLAELVPLEEAPAGASPSAVDEAVEPPAGTESAATSDLIPVEGWLADYVNLYTPLGEAPPEAHLAAGLALLSAAVGWRAHLQFGDAREPVTLFVMLVGGSATSRKTSTARNAQRLAEIATRGDSEPGLRVRGIGHTSDKGLLDLVGAPSIEVAADWERDYPPGHLLVWDEAGGILGRPGDLKGTEWMGRVRSTLMTMHGGRVEGSQTAQDKRPSTRCAVSLLGTMTTQELVERGSAELIGDGFLGRMCLIGGGDPGPAVPIPAPMTPEQIETRDRLAGRLRAVVRGGGMGEVFARFDEGARQARRAWYVPERDRLLAASRLGHPLDVARYAAFGRLQATAVRLAALSAVSRADPAVDLSQVSVSARDVEFGARFAEHAMAVLMRVAEEGGRSRQDRVEDAVVAYLERHGGSSSLKALGDGVRVTGMGRAATRRAVEDLARDGRVVVEVVTTGGRPRKDVRLAE